MLLKKYYHLAETEDTENVLKYSEESRMDIFKCWKGFFGRMSRKKQEKAKENPEKYRDQSQNKKNDEEEKVIKQESKEKEKKEEEPKEKEILKENEEGFQEKKADKEKNEQND